MIDPLRVWVAEWIVCGFFAYLAVLASTFRISRSRRRRVLTVSTFVPSCLRAFLRYSPHKRRFATALCCTVRGSAAYIVSRLYTLKLRIGGE